MKKLDIAKMMLFKLDIEDKKVDSGKQTKKQHNINSKKIILKCLDKLED